MRSSLACLLCLVLITCGHASAASVTYAAKSDSDATLGFDRSRYGHNDADLPIWSPLTKFESRVIAQSAALHHHNVEAMLALYLLASGDVRTEAEFARDQKRFNHWVSRIRPQVMSMSTPKARASVVYQDMRREFFARDDPSSRLPAGYVASQSRLSEIFRSGKYNCISSAMLYILAAEAFGLHARGVVLPSHAFVQLDLDHGRKIEVETTVSQGFGVVHDKAYFKSLDRQLSKVLKLPPSTYDDYLHRAIVSPLALGVFNMDVQHTEPKRMPYEERMRLAEIRSTLAPGNMNAQMNRLYYYGHELNYLNRRRDHATMARLFDRVGPWLMSRSVKDFDDKNWRTRLATMQVDMGYALIEGHQGAAGLAVSRRLLKSLPASLEDYRTLRDDLFSNLGQYVQSTAAAGHFVRARHALDGHEAECFDHKNCAASLGFLYSRWSEVYWHKHDWPRVIRVVREYLRLDTSGKNTRLFNHNLEAAYLNLARSHLLNDDRHGAENALMACVISAKGADLCRSELAGLKRHGSP